MSESRLRKMMKEKETVALNTFHFICNVTITRSRDLTNVVLLTNGTNGTSCMYVLRGKYVLSKDTLMILIQNTSYIFCTSA